MSRLIGVLIRTFLTAWLLIKVYQGSRVALVIVLALLVLAVELLTVLIRLRTSTTAQRSPGTLHRYTDTP